MTQDEPIEAVVARVNAVEAEGYVSWIWGDAQRLAREVERLQKQYDIRGEILEQAIDQRDILLKVAAADAEECDQYHRERDEARADNAALIALLGEPHATECRNPDSHPGAELLARIERLRAVAQEVERFAEPMRPKPVFAALDALQPGDLGGGA